MIIVFIDTNIYLKMFNYPNNGSTHLDELINLKESKKILIVFPQIIQNEILRNIDSSTATYKKQIENTKVEKPKFKEIHDEETRLKIEKAFKLWTEATEELNKKYVDNIEKIRNRIFNDFKKNTQEPEELEELVELAHHRKIKGYPPGKRQHIGDELSWEILKKYYVEQDLTIISFDSDWNDGGNKNKINSQLEVEWKRVSKKKIILYDSLGEFINKLSGKSVISKGKIKEEKKGSSGTSQSFPYAFPVTFSSNISTYPVTFTTASTGPSSSVSWGSVPTTSTSFSVSPSASTTTTSTSSGATISRIGTIGSLGCKNCGHYLSFIDNFCPKCGTKRE